MKLTSTCCVLLAAGLCKVAANGTGTSEGLHTLTASKHSDEGGIPTIQKNFNGWVNPEDLTPMPQCISQQDQSTWLSTMTKCTSKRCTSHFGVICTHHQWLTQLSCLGTEFSEDAIRDYVPYCGRSVLAKAQLYYWIRKATGRTWLVDVGDANRLQTLSPASLTRGYAAISATYNAPTCLTDSLSAPSMEPFQHVMGSCSFTSTTERTGNTARPWEYSESRRSMTALGFETVGYNLTGGNIRYGDYFDKECFCSVFTAHLNEEPCSELGQLDLTKERLWINATCGPTSLPDNWTDMLKTIGFAYIPIKGWHWPACVMDMPKQVTGLIDQCATDACGLDSSGYCKVERAIDRTCFCRNISYDSCPGLCHTFETRIDYVEWLHHLCGNVQDWHGLPDNWRQLASPYPLEMIPWRWTLKPSNNSNVTSITRLGPIEVTEKCASNEKKLRSFALVNMATFLAAFISQRKTIVHRIVRNSPWHWWWFSRGIVIATLELLANCFNVFLVRETLGYEDVPVVQLMLLWCSMPRLGWLTIWPISAQPFGAISLSAFASSLFAEVIHQGLSSYYMLLTISYGLEHNFYFRNLESAERGQSATIMYFGALMWFIVIAAAFALLMRAVQRINRMTGPDGDGLSRWQAIHYWIEQSRALGETSSTDGERGNYTVYGTLFVESRDNRLSRELLAKLYTVTAVGMLLLWVAHWLFWGGFIGLSSEEYVFIPHTWSMIYEANRT
ncbi:hypothetical protein PT974_05441 [Cladobotryum mycophilum]|uniref:Uncharacterized protein n=1 Tax=Cladobotryum mycophilum TaxID=491253 RepID=A0ABR0SJV2_9HYPO